MDTEQVANQLESATAEMNRIEQRMDSDGTYDAKHFETILEPFVKLFGDVRYLYDTSVEFAAKYRVLATRAEMLAGSDRLAGGNGHLGQLKQKLEKNVSGLEDVPFPESYYAALDSIPEPARVGGVKSPSLYSRFVRDDANALHLTDAGLFGGLVTAVAFNIFAVGPLPLMVGFASGAVVTMLFGSVIITRIQLSMK